MVVSALPLIGVVGFAVLSVVLAVAAVRGRAGTLPKGSVLGLHNREVEASERAWRAAHRAAWPILAAAAAVAAFHAAGCLIAGLGMGADGASFSQALVFSGLIVIMALWFVASAAGVNAVKRLPPE
jgi:hypothetical protein